MNALLRMLVALLLYVAFGLVSVAQLGPMNWTEPIKVQANDIFLLWHDAPEVGNQTHAKVYSYDFLNQTLPPEEQISNTERGTFPGTEQASFSNVATGHFKKSARENVVAVWGPGNDGLRVQIMQFDTTSVGWTAPGSTTISGDIQNDRIYVRTVDMDGDDLDEFIVTYLDSQDSIHINLYDVDSLLQPTLIATHCDQRTFTDNTNYDWVRYAIATGDLNGDGDEELVIMRMTSNDGDYHIQLYDLQGGTVSAEGSYSGSAAGGGAGPCTIVEMSLTVGDFVPDEKQELAVTVAVRWTSGQRVARAKVLEVAPDLQQINYLDYPSVFVNFSSGGMPLASTCGDFNGDGLDELVFAVNNTVHIVRTNDTLLLVNSFIASYTVSLGGDYLQARSDFVHASDVNQDGRPDILVAYDDLSDGEGGFHLMVFSVDSTFEQTLIGEIQHDEDNPINGTDPPQYSFRPYSIAMGNFDGMGYTIGEPSHHVATEVAQPIVVLNAPPVHFDVLDGTTYDLNTCYNGADCEFTARYEKVTTSSTEVSTTIQSDWAISTGLSVSGSLSAGATVEVAPLGVGGSISVGVSTNFENHLLATFGGHFSNTSSAGSTLTVGVEVTASDDDRIYSTVTDYDVWEYPVYQGNETTPRNMILTYVPLSSQGTWYPSKSYNAADYVPNHEVGNVLSYLPYAHLDSNPDMGQAIAADYASNSFVLDASSNIDWSLSMADFQSSSADTMREMGADVGLGIGPIRFDGDYNATQMNNHSVSVTNLINLAVHLGGLDMGIGDVKYTVTPYAYWNQQGTLVLDYAAKPEVAPPGLPATWWEEQYGDLPNPTFVLPWKLDPEKGFALTDPIKRKQTKDIFTTPSYPLPGDTVIITARVRNFSLMGTLAPVSGSFYLGDPEAGGVPIIGLSGSNTISTSGPIPAQEWVDLELHWAFPNGVPLYPRIFVVLDEDGTIDEVHETDNTGFNVMNYAGGVGVDELPMADGGYLLAPCFPNPFSDFTYIDYSIPAAGNVMITVFDQTGRVVEQPVNQHQGPGPHRAIFNGAGHAPGVYYYSLRSGDFHDVRKMILVR